MQDISVSRSNERARNWGVPVPDDPTQRIYVWFDALNIYQSGIGFGWDEKLYEKWWPADVHTIGKGISRFHTVYWPAFLLSAGLKLPKAVFIHGYLTVNGNKISKSDPASVIDPIPLIEKYGADAIRYFLLAKISPFDDGDFSEEKLVETYNSDLANGIGNLVARVAKLAEKINYESNPFYNKFFGEVSASLDKFRFDEAIDFIWERINLANHKIDEVEPWKIEPNALKLFLDTITRDILFIAVNLKPFLPETAEKIEKQFTGKITVGPSLFPRISK